MLGDTSVYGDWFFLYAAAGGKLRLAVSRLTGMVPEAVLRLGAKSLAPGGAVTCHELAEWLHAVRQAGITVELVRLQAPVGFPAW